MFSIVISCSFYFRLLTVVCLAVLHVALQFNDCFVCLANECDLFEKAEDFSTHTFIADATRGELRSPYAKFLWGMQDSNVFEGDQKIKPESGIK